MAADLIRAIALAVLGIALLAPAIGAQDEATLRASRAEAVRMRDDLNRRIAEIDRQLAKHDGHDVAPSSVNSFADLPATGAGYVAPSPSSRNRSHSVSGQTCFVGPRGGTYTITKSGKKNYGGC
jgi:hypothetical protein